MSKEQILKRIRRSLNRNGPLPTDVETNLRAGLKKPRAHVRPAFDGDLLARFERKLHAVAGSSVHCTTGQGISAAVLEYLELNELPLDIVVSDDDLVGRVDWSNKLQVKRGLPDPEDQTSVTGAFVAIAETGTVVMLSSPQSPTTLNFLPENHIVAVRRENIVRHQEEAWDALRNFAGGMPRTANLITGPSRTGDVEQVLQLGAHGPRQLHVLVVDD